GLGNGLGYYTAVVTNSLGRQTSSVAYLDTPMTTTGPTDTIVPVGGNTSLTVTAAGGAAPYAYQWAHNGNNVGANSSSLVLNNAQQSDAGAYNVTVTDVLGQSVTSAT